ncbi:hypothetical protein AB0D78_08240 [Streptomyces avermitilis]|uniref:hypothetical protein n=1 Tax=Streptomyces avermitilis TaxID=33903 RepID=UPI0033CBD55A
MATTERGTDVPRGVAWCAWHEGLSDSARLVQDAAGNRRFACRSCRRSYDLVPIADAP